MQLEKHKRILKEVFNNSEEASEDLIARYALTDLSVDVLSDVNESDFTTFKKSITIAALALALSEKDRKSVVAEADWALVDYGDYRNVLRKTAVKSAVDSWKYRDYLLGEDFTFNPNDKAIDRTVSNIASAKIKAYNSQEQKRISIVVREGRKHAWTPERTAAEIKRGAGLNSVQQKTLFNVQTGLVKEGFSKQQIGAKTSEYIDKAKSYRADMTARWDSVSAVNEGHSILWAQLVGVGLISENSRKEWVAILDQRTGESDAAMHGQVVKITDNFRDPLMVYPPLMRPPLRSNCRCDMRLVPKWI